ncbi:MAG: D-alanine--D-alanine ligase [Desulfitibacter sp. BRH_c19]|nr:MAG: D-alanine--D-alanine ligase [Desulfitibacter sp. BRH_c19]
MKVAIVYNRDSQAVINLFGVPNREKYGLQTINMIRDAIKAGGKQVKTFEGDKNIISKLEEFMPSVISGERPGLVFNLSYGIQGRARYTHIPSILEMLGVPYVGSDPQTHAIALDKVVTKIILKEKGMPTPKFAVLENPRQALTDDLAYPLIVKPKDEAVSFGLRIVNNEEELREGAKVIWDMFQGATLVEEYIEGREVNVGLLGNDPVEALPLVELVFGEGEQIYTYEDKISKSGRTIEKICPAPLSEDETKKVQELAVAAFKAIGCFDCARVDFRIDKQGNPYILEINSMPSLGAGGSYVYAAGKMGLNYGDLVNRFIETAAKRYFGTSLLTPFIHERQNKKETDVFRFHTKNRDKMEECLKAWTNLPSWTDDVVGLSTVVRRFEERITKLGLKPVDEFTNGRSAWTWQTKAGLNQGTLLVVPVDVPRDRGGYPVPFRKDPEWLYGEGIGSSRAGIVCILQTLEALRFIKKLHTSKIGVFIYSDEGRGMRYSSSFLRNAVSNARQVLVLQPGFKGGKVVDQRRGSRKFSILVEGGSLRIGSKNTQLDVLSWFLHRIDRIMALNQPEKKLSVAVQEINSERHSMLLPHRVRLTLYVTYLNNTLADNTEKQIEKIFTGDTKGINVYIEKLEDRAPLIRSRTKNPVIISLKSLCEEWKLPFGVESSLLPSAGGEGPSKVPVVCGVGPACKDLYTPNEAVHRGELLQRLLLLTLFLLRD